MTRQELEKLARKKMEKQRQNYADPRFKKVIGKFVSAGLLEHNRVPPFRGRISLEEVLWAGEIEPRILELLPSVLLRRPKLIEIRGDIPEDLRAVLVELRRAVATREFRGVEPHQYRVWLDRIGRKPTVPSVLKTFRFKKEDVDRLNDLRKRTGNSEAEIVRLALKNMDIYFPPKL